MNVSELDKKIADNKPLKRVVVAGIILTLITFFFLLFQITRLIGRFGMAAAGAYEDKFGSPFQAQNNATSTGGLFVAPTFQGAGVEKAWGRPYTPEDAQQ